MDVFCPADILLPKQNLEKWAVIACDQFTSQPEYWERVEEYVGEDVSSLRVVFPEVWLGNEDECRIAKINETMREYLEQEVFVEYPDSLIYVEREQLDGKKRCGIIGAIDLEAYDFTKNSTAEIRATEKTVMERIPPRVKIRENALVELPHIILFCDDEKKRLIESVRAVKHELKIVYDFELMEGGGRITGWLLDPLHVEAFLAEFDAYKADMEEKYRDIIGKPMLFATGDGNHSLATAKTCYENLKKNRKTDEALDERCRYALVELENLHSGAHEFEPIHRLAAGVDVEKLLHIIEERYFSEDGYQIPWYSAGKEGVISLDKNLHQLPVGALQKVLDEYLNENEGIVDYIHGEEELEQLSQGEAAIGFKVPTIERDALFRTVMLEGSLPRKTFSVGQATEKRYYLEARRI